MIYLKLVRVFILTVVLWTLVILRWVLSIPGIIEDLLVSIFRYYLFDFKIRLILGRKRYQIYRIRKAPLWETLNPAASK